MTLLRFMTIESADNAFSWLHMLGLRNFLKFGLEIEVRAQNKEEKEALDRVLRAFDLKAASYAPYAPLIYTQRKAQLDGVVYAPYVPRYYPPGWDAEDIAVDCLLRSRTFPTVAAKYRSHQKPTTALENDVWFDRALERHCVFRGGEWRTIESA